MASQYHCGHQCAMMVVQQSRAIEQGEVDPNNKENMIINNMKTDKANKESKHVTCQQATSQQRLHENSLPSFEEELLSLMLRCDLTVPIMQQKEAPRARIMSAIQLLIECFENERTTKRKIESFLATASNEIVRLKNELACRSAEFDSLRDELHRRDEVLEDLRDGLNKVMRDQKARRNRFSSMDSSTQTDFIPSSKDRLCDNHESDVMGLCCKKKHITQEDSTLMVSSLRHEIQLLGSELNRMRGMWKDTTQKLEKECRERKIIEEFLMEIKTVQPPRSCHDHLSSDEVEQELTEMDGCTYGVHGRKRDSQKNSNDTTPGGWSANERFRDDQGEFQTEIQTLRKELHSQALAAARLNYRILLERDQLIGKILYTFKRQQNGRSNPSKRGTNGLAHAKSYDLKGGHRLEERGLIAMEEPFTEKQFSKVKLMLEKFVSSGMD